jgi:hypothetical protein
MAFSENQVKYGNRYEKIKKIKKINLKSATHPQNRSFDFTFTPSIKFNR